MAASGINKTLLSNTSTEQAPNVAEATRQRYTWAADISQKRHKHYEKIECIRRPASNAILQPRTAISGFFGGVGARQRQLLQLLQFRQLPAKSAAYAVPETTTIAADGPQEYRRREARGCNNDAIATTSNTSNAAVGKQSRSSRSKYIKCDRSPMSGAVGASAWSEGENRNWIWGYSF